MHPSFTPTEQRLCLETVVLARAGLDPAGNRWVRPMGEPAFNIHHGQLVRFLSLDQLGQCLLDHGVQLGQFFCAQLDLKRPFVLVEMDHQGARWLSLDDRGVDLPADDLAHAYRAFMEASGERLFPIPATPSDAAQGNTP